ncbi:MAG: hypothetical protein WAU33_15080 [Candidatus Binataceae bacterium]
MSIQIPEDHYDEGYLQFPQIATLIAGRSLHGSVSLNRTADDDRALRDHGLRQSIGAVQVNGAARD